MKNLFLTVVLLLTVSFSFANNEVEKISTYDVEETFEVTNSVKLLAFDFTTENYSITKIVGTCYVTIGFYDSDGNKVAQRTIQFNNVSSEKECSDIADKLAKELENL